MLIADSFLHTRILRACIEGFMCWSPSILERPLRTVFSKARCRRDERRGCGRRHLRRARAGTRCHFLRVRPVGDDAARTMGARSFHLTRPSDRGEPHATLRRDAPARCQQHCRFLLLAGAHRRRCASVAARSSTECRFFAPVITWSDTLGVRAYCLTRSAASSVARSMHTRLVARAS